MKKQIVNSKIVLIDKVLNSGTVVIENGKIIYVGESRFDGVETLDAQGGYLLAGFIDLHCHGGNGFDFMDADINEIDEISRYHLSHGTTTLIPTTMTDDWEHTLWALDRLSYYYQKNSDTTLYGAHLEGPWLSPKQCGAQAPEKMDLPSVEKLKDIVSKYPFINRVSVAPELTGGMEIGKFGSQSGLIMSIAHTDADFDTVINAKRNGYSLMTHLYSGMQGVVRKNAFRVAGAVEAGLYDDDIFVEIIADGKHLPDGLLKLIYKCKGADKICLITDAMRASGFKDGQTSILGRKDGGLPVVVEDGVAKTLDRQGFAGSVATADRLLKTMLSVGVDIVSVSKMLSLTPAKLIGLTDRGSIETGKRADLVLTDENFTVKKVVFNGNLY